MAPRRLMIADAHAVVVAGLRSLLGRHFEVVATVTNGPALLDVVRRAEPDLLLLDFSMPGVSGLKQILAVSRLPKPPGIVVLTMHDDPFLADEACRAGASGFLSKTSSLETVVEALRVADESRAYSGAARADAATAARVPGAGSAGGPFQHLTARQTTIVEMLAAGQSTKRIAAQLGLSRRTVEAHKYQAMRILSVSNVAGLIRAAILCGLVRSGDDSQPPG
jgi:DNA-binding NarL/FixJ family response regulator